MKAIQSRLGSLLHHFRDCLEHLGATPPAKEMTERTQLGPCLHRGRNRIQPYGASARNSRATRSVATHAPGSQQTFLYSEEGPLTNDVQLAHRANSNQHSRSNSGSTPFAPCQSQRGSVDLAPRVDSEPKKPLNPAAAKALASRLLPVTETKTDVAISPISPFSLVGIANGPKPRN